MKARMAGVMPRASDSVGLGAEPRLCVSYKVPGDADAAGPGTTL